MGDWRSANGVQTIYKRGESAKLQPLPEKRAKTIGFDDAWQLSVSAKEFTALLDNSAQAQVETRDNSYLVSYHPQAVNNAFGIVQAAIILNKEDLHAIEQTFTLRDGDETREYRMVETGYDWKPANTVAPAVFEPNVELTGRRAETRSLESVPETVPPADVVAPDSNTNTEAGPSATMATPALEVEVVEALNNAGAFMGEQVNVTRGADGKILVSALVETAERKKDLLGALANFKNNPAVRLKIETVAEAQARARRPTGGQTTEPGTVDQVEVTEGMSPVYAELRKRFSDDEARSFANRILARSRQARQHALAAKQLSDRFSPADLQSLSPAERERWLSLIRSHANAFLNETESLRRELQQIFPEAAGGTSGGGAIGSDTDLQAKVQQLYDASLAVDKGLGSSFALTAGGSSNAPIKSSSFWRSFANAVGIAKSLAAAR
jgi:hypothetical protein